MHSLEREGIKLYGKLNEIGGEQLAEVAGWY